MLATAAPRPLQIPNLVAGEAFSAGAVVYVDSFNARGNGANRCYKADNAATGPVKIGPIVGVAVTAGTTGNGFVFQAGGTAYGFSGLTPGGLVWLGTNGGVVQTQPALPASGSQVVVALIGFAVSSTSIFLYDLPLEVSFVKFQSAMSVGASATVEHWSDAGARAREAFAYLVNTLDPTLVGYYKFDDGTGSTTADASGNTGPGTLQNSPTWSTSVPSGLSFSDPYCLTFDGGTQTVSIPNNSLLNLTGSYSFGMWVKPTLTGANKCLLCKSDGNLVNYSVYVTVSPLGQIAFYAFNGTTSFAAQYSGTGVTVPSGQWSYVAYVITGTTITFYAVTGGVLTASTATLPYAPNTNTGALTIGSYTGGGGPNQYVAGSLDSVGIWNRALSSAEIQSLGNGNPPAMYDSPITPGNPTVNSGATSNVNVRYADSTFQNPATFTTFTNASGQARDIACEVII